MNISSKMEAKKKNEIRRRGKNEKRVDKTKEREEGRMGGGGGGGGEEDRMKNRKE